MKKVISFAFCILLGAGAVWAADFKSDTTIAPGLTITAHPDRYEVRYKLPPFHEEIVETENGRFSKIVFEDDADFLDEGGIRRTACAASQKHPFAVAKWHFKR